MILLRKLSGARTPRWNAWKDVMIFSQSTKNRTVKRLAVVLLAGTLVSVLLCVLPLCGCGSKKHQESKGSKVLIVGVDGADWEILDSLRDRGEIPNFDRLTKEGSHGLLRSIEPLLSPLVWTSIATGKTPDKHGILDFVVRDPDTGNHVPITSDMRQVHALWNIAGAMDRKVAFVGWLATWPAEDVNGIMVSDRLSYQSALLEESSRSGLCSPSSYTAVAESVAALAAQVPPEVLGDFVKVSPEELQEAQGNSYDVTDPVNNLRLIYITSETYRRLALDILAKENPDLMGVYFEETDSVGHLFMPYAPPRRHDVTEDQVHRFGGAVDASYRHMDDILGELISAAGDEYTIIVVSDHGFKSGDARPYHTPAPREPGAAEWHRLHGVVILWGPHIKSGVTIEGASVLDITPTVLTLMGLPVAKDMDGQPLTAAIDDDFLREHQVERIDSYENLFAEGPGSRESKPGGSPVDEEMLKKLRALGYLGSGPEQKEKLETGEQAAGGIGKGSLEAERQAGADSTGGAEQEKLSSWHINKGVALLKEKRYKEAELEFKSAASKDPANPIAHNNLGLVAMETGRAAEAEASFRKAVSLSPDYVNAHINLALLYDSLGRDSKALEEYQEALRIEPSRASIHNAVGNFFAKRGRFSEALPHMQKAVELDPYSAKLHRDIGAVYCNLGDLQKGADHFGKAVSLEPDSAESHLLLAQVLLALGKEAEARTHLEKCLSLDPGNAEAKRLLNK
jgi:tetratricopeptide (TPR) repeat protein/predicted AlkP superfamily phosphohydrolase/phosphomutase